MADTTGGTKTITATGATSGLTATTSYTVNPWAAFYNSESGVTSFSFTGSAPTSLLIEVHGMQAGTIAANSVTIGGVSTNHQSVVIGTTGAYGGAGAFLVASPTANVPFGPATVVVGGTTFSYGLGNIAFGSTPGTWGGAVISSIVTTAGVGTGVVTTDASSYKPGTGFTASTTSTAPAQNQIGVFGYGFVNGATVTITPPPALGALTPVIALATVNTIGAFFATYTLADTPWSTTVAPATPSTYTLSTSTSSNPANILSPTIGVTPWIQSPTATSVDYTTSTEAVTAHGFSASETLTLTIGGSSMASGGTCTTSTAGTCTTAAGQVPDIAGGAQSAAVAGTLSGQTVTSTGAVTYSPLTDFTSGQTLSINSGGAGQTTVIRTGIGYGVHGLAANTVYNIVWNAISGGQTVGTFTSSATGGIPIPGKQFTVPSDSSGIHIIDIQTATGASALFGSLALGQTTPSETPFSSTYTTAFGDMLFNNIALLQAAPSVAIVGSPETISGSGLSAGGAYVVALGTSSTHVNTNAPALTTFTATATGDVPSSTSVTLADTATTLETGTLEYLAIQTTAHYGVSTTPDAYAQFVLAASASMNMTSAPAGHSVTLTAHALNSGGVYSIIFDYVQSAFSSTSYTGTTVGVIAPNSVGAGSATFNIPATATAGTYPIELVVSSAGTGGAAVGTAVLNLQLSLTVGGTSGSCTNEGTSCMGISGTPSVSKSGGNTIISATFTNNSNAPQTGYIYAVVHNALGQTVYYTTATVSPAAGASQTGQLVLFGLPSGTYSATVFVVSSSGTAISGTTNVSVTI